MTVVDLEQRHIILAAVDGTASSDAVIRSAIVAARSARDGEIHFVFVAEPPLSDPPMPSVPQLVEDGRRVLDDVLTKASRTFVGHLETHLVVDLAATGILQLADELAAELIVVGTNGKHCLQRLFLGSVSRTVVDRAHCAVLVARPVAYPAPVAKTA